MVAPRLLLGSSLLLGLLACPSGDDSGAGEDLAAISSRLDTTEERLTAIETKLDALTTKLDQTAVSFEPLATWATERKAAEEQRVERDEGRGTSLGREPTEYEPPSSGSREIPGAAEAIACDDSDPAGPRCTVERAFIESLMANPAMLAKQARVVPSQRDGVVRGFKLYGIRRGTLPKLLGMKNGDMIVAINGEKLSSIDKVMELYTKLRRASHLEFELERKGSPLTLQLEVK